MVEREVAVQTRYGRQPAYVACPEGGGAFPPVILYMDAPGIREELRAMARRIAKHGYFCLLPDLYYRLGTLRFDVPRRDEAMSVAIRGAMESLSNAAIVEDTAGMIAFLDGEDRVKPGAVGCIGHCMSGGFVVAVAAHLPRVKAVASLYGVGLVTDKPDSPHLSLDRSEAELYFGFAESDPHVPATVVADLKAALEKAGSRYRLDVYPGTRHGFCFAARADYDAVAAEAAWTRVFDLLERNLK
jgi:carboxymethylenebutenolidase